MGVLSLREVSFVVSCTLSSSNLFSYLIFLIRSSIMNASCYSVVSFLFDGLTGGQLSLSLFVLHLLKL